MLIEKLEWVKHSGSKVSSLSAPVEKGRGGKDRS